jgi:hypothetical protein
MICQEGSSECPLLSFDNGDDPNITYILASALILDYEVVIHIFPL